MKNIMTFEAFAGKPLPVAPLHVFANYYSCPSCQAIYISPNRDEKCQQCGKKVRIIGSEEFDAEVEKRVSPEEYREYLADRESFMDDIIPLGALDRDDKNKYHEN